MSLCRDAMARQEPSGTTWRGEGPYRFVPQTGLTTFLEIEDVPRARYSGHLVLSMTTLVATDVPLTTEVVRTLAAINGRETTGQWQWMKGPTEGIGDVGRRFAVIVGPSVGSWLDAAWPALTDEHLERAQQWSGVLKGTIPGTLGGRPLEVEPAAADGWRRPTGPSVGHDLGEVMRAAVVKVAGDREGRSPTWWIEEDDAGQYAVKVPIVSGAAAATSIWCSFIIEHIGSHPDAGPGIFVGIEPPEPFQISQPELSSDPGSLEDELVVLQAAVPELLPRLASWIWRAGRTRVATFLPGSMLATLRGDVATGLVAYAVRGLVSTLEERAALLGLRDAMSVAELLARVADLDGGDVVRDHGPEAVAGLHDRQLQPDAAWESEALDGFAWWPTSWRQVVHREPAVVDLGVDVAVVHVATDVAAVVAEPSDLLVEALDEVNADDLFGMVLALGDDGRVRLHSALTFHEGNFSWSMDMLGQVAAVAIEVGRAFCDRRDLEALRVEPDVTPGPSGDWRTAPDSIVDVPPFLREQGRSVAWAGERVLLDQLSRSMPFAWVADEGGCRTRAPLVDPWTGEQTGWQDLRVRPPTESPHFGAAARLESVPDVALPVPATAAGAAALNTAMLGASFVLPIAGPWCATGGAVAVRSALPLSLARRGSPEHLAQLVAVWMQRMIRQVAGTLRLVSDGMTAS